MSLESLLKIQGKSSLDSSTWENYYEGNVHLDALGVSLPPDVRVLEMTAPFPKLAVDVLTEVLTPEGYLLSGEGGEETSELLRTWWQVNNLDTACHLAITDALVQGQVFWIVGPSSDGHAPLVTSHSKATTSAHYGPQGQVIEAAHTYTVGEDTRVAHYLPGQTVYYRWSDNKGDWVRHKTVDTGLTRVPVVPMTNKARMDDRYGRSELAELIKLTDAASRTLTNLQVAQELLSMPQRFIFGDGADTQFQERAQKISAYFGGLIVGPSGSQAYQLTGADLNPLINTYKLYAQQISAVTGIPLAMLGITTDNPTSAEALRVAKERLITRAEVKQSMFGDALEEVARLELEVMGVSTEGVETLEMQWRDPATPSQSAVMTLALQAQAQGVLSNETTREFMRLSPEQRARENQNDSTDDHSVPGFVPDTLQAWQLPDADRSGGSQYLSGLAGTTHSSGGDDPSGGRQVEGSGTIMGSRRRGSGLAGGDYEGTYRRRRRRHYAGGGGNKFTRYGG